MAGFLFEMPNGDCAYQYYQCIVVRFNGKRKTVSTAILNGGYREDLTAIFNHDCNPGAGMACALRAPAYKEHLQLVAADLGLMPETTSGLGTAASMDNVSVQTLVYKDLRVTALVTGGVEVNGGRAGDPADYYEPLDKQPYRPGTINLFLLIDADLPAGALTRAIVTATEAKTAALQELMAGSNYSYGLATGSGTDGTIAVANADSPLYLEGAGKHTKLGELIGLTVKTAVKEALYKQTGLCGDSQRSCLKRFKRFGLCEETIWRDYCNAGGCREKAVFLDALYRLDCNTELVMKASLYIHLADQFLWGLFDAQAIRQETDCLLKALCGQYGVALPVDGREPYSVELASQSWSLLMARILFKQLDQAT